MHLTTITMVHYYLECLYAPNWLVYMYFCDTAYNTNTDKHILQQLTVVIVVVVVVLH